MRWHGWNRVGSFRRSAITPYITRSHPEKSYGVGLLPESGTFYHGASAWGKRVRVGRFPEAFSEAGGFARHDECAQANAEKGTPTQSAKMKQGVIASCLKQFKGILRKGA